MMNPFRPNQGLHPLHQGGEGGRIEGGDDNGVETSAEGCQKRPVRNAIPLVEDPKGRLASQVEILEDLLDGGDLRLKGRVTHVDHMEEDVRSLEFVKRRPEGGHEFLRQVPNETHRIGDDRLGIFWKAEARAFRIERGEEAVLGEDFAFRQGIQERGLSGIGVAHDGDDGELRPFPSKAPLSPGLLDILQFLFQMVDPFPDSASVDLQLGLSGSCPADPPRQPGKTGVLQGEPGEAVFELRQFHLNFSLPAVGAPGEDVEDHLGPVDHLHFGEIGEGADLGGGQLMVEDKEIRVHLHRPDDEVGELSLADKEARVHFRPTLDHGVEDLDVAGPAELTEFGERSLPVEERVCFHSDENGAVDGLHLPGLLPSCKLAFESRDEGGEVEIQLGGVPWGEGHPEASFGVFGDEVSGLGITGKTIVSCLQGADQIEAQQGEVRQIVRGEVFAGQVCVDQTESSESAGGGTEAVQGGDKDAVVRPHDDVSDFTPAGDQEADLTIDLAGEFRERPGQFMGDDPLRREAPPIELSDPFDLRRSEAGQVAVNLFYDGSFNLSGSIPRSVLRPLRSRVLRSVLRGGSFKFLRVDPLFHMVKEGRPRIRPEGGGLLFYLIDPAGRAMRICLSDLHDPFEDMAAGGALIFVNRHSSLRGFDGSLRFLSLNP